MAYEDINESGGPSARLHLQKGNVLRRAVTFPKGGHGDVFVAGYLVIHLHSTSLDCSLYMEKALKVQSIQRRN